MHELATWLGYFLTREKDNGSLTFVASCYFQYDLAVTATFYHIHGDSSLGRYGLRRRLGLLSWWLRNMVKQYMLSSLKFLKLSYTSKHEGEPHTCQG